MKHSTTSLLKFQRLQRRLNESKRGLVGLLELLWHGTATQAPEGDIGRFTNEEIAILVDWSGDPDQLVAALVETKWIDVSDEKRLVVHDWAEHAPNWVRLNARRKAVRNEQAASRNQMSTILAKSHEASHEAKLKSHEASHDASHEAKLKSHEASHDASHDASHEASHERVPNLTLNTNTNTAAMLPADVCLEPEGLKRKRQKKVFVKPTVQEIAAFCCDKQLNVDAQDWWDYYEARGWLMHRTPMVDWQAAVRNAARRGWCPKSATGVKARRVDAQQAAITADYIRAKQQRGSTHIVD